MLQIGDWDRIVLTGGSGFLGRRLRAALPSGTDVVEVVSPARFASHQQVGTMSSASSTAAFAARLAGARSILLLHLATRYVPSGAPCDIDELLESNVMFPSRLVDAAASTDAYVRVVNPSTIFQYYGASRDRPISLYAASKAAFREMLRGYGLTRGVHVADLVLGDSFAVDDHRPKLIPHLLHCARSGDTARLGSGRQRMSLMHADDVVQAMAHAADLPRGAFEGDECRTWLVGGATTVSVAELVVRVQDAFGGRPTCEFHPSRDRPHEMHHGLDALDLSSLPGFVASRSLDAFLHDVARRG